MNVMTMNILCNQHDIHILRIIDIMTDAIFTLITYEALHCDIIPFIN